MGSSDNPQDTSRPTSDARASGTPSPSAEDKPKQGERGKSSVAMRARKGKQERKEPRKKERPTVEEKPAQEEERAEAEGEQTMRKGIYLSALIWVEGDWPAARDFTAPAKAAAKDALSRAFEGEQDGLTLRLKGLEVRNDVEDDEEGDASGKQQEEKFEF